MEGMKGGPGFIGKLRSLLGSVFGLFPLGGTNGGIIVRQLGGTAGTDELEISHDGTRSVIRSRDGAVRLLDYSGVGFDVINDSGVVVQLSSTLSRLQLVASSQVEFGTWTSNIGTGAFYTTGSGYHFGWNNNAAGFQSSTAGVVRVSNMSTGDAWLQQSAGDSRVTADVTNGTITMANITGLSSTLIAGRKYQGRLVLFVNDSVAADGIKADFDGGTATMTSFRAHGTVWDTALLLSTQVTAIATDFAVGIVTGDAMIEIYFGFVCNAAGTFIPRFAKNSHTTGTGTVYLNSHMTIRDVP